MRRADLTKAVLKENNPSKADLSGADLAKAQFWMKYIGKTPAVTLKETVLQGTTMAQVDLSIVDMSRVIR